MGGEGRGPGRKGLAGFGFVLRPGSWGQSSKATPTQAGTQPGESATSRVSATPNPNGGPPLARTGLRVLSAGSTQSQGSSTGTDSLGVASDVYTDFGSGLVSGSGSPHPPMETPFILLIQVCIGGAPVLGTHALPGFQSAAGPDPA